MNQTHDGKSRIWRAIIPVFVVICFSWSQNQNARVFITYSKLIETQKEDMSFVFYKSHLSLFEFAYK